MRINKHNLISYIYIYIYIFYIYICYPTLKASQHHYFVHLIFKSNFTTTNVFLLYFSCVLQSTLVLFGPLWSYFVHIGHMQSNSIHSINFGLFSPSWSYLVHFGSIWSRSMHSVLFTINSTIKSTKGV